MKVCLGVVVVPGAAVADVVVVVVDACADKYVFSIKF